MRLHACACVCVRPCLVEGVCAPRPLQPPHPPPPARPNPPDGSVASLPLHLAHGPALRAAGRPSSPGRYGVETERPLQLDSWPPPPPRAASRRASARLSMRKPPLPAAPEEAEAPPGASAPLEACGQMSIVSQSWRVEAAGRHAGATTYESCNAMPTSTTAGVACAPRCHWSGQQPGQARPLAVFFTCCCCCCSRTSSVCHATSASWAPGGGSTGSTIDDGSDASGQGAPRGKRQRRKCAAGEGGKGRGR